MNRIIAPPQHHCFWRLIYLLIVPVFLLAGCDRERVVWLHIIVPNEFKGLIKLVEDPGGTEVPFESGAYVYRIPTNGVLLVTKVKGFPKWHRAKANFVNGVTLPVDPQVSNGVVALFELGRSPKKQFLFVGTTSEKENAMKDSFHLLR